jgi:hypothetical protein
MKPSELIADKANWTHSTRCRDVLGNPCHPDDAVAWDGNGAIDACYPHPGDRKFWLQRVREYCLANYGTTMSHVNDWYGHEEVVRALKECGC